MTDIQKICRPTLLLDKDRCLANIKSMHKKAINNNIELRPHFKTHQSHEVGRWFRDFGINKIATSSLYMAEYFANDGWDDITVAFPTNILEIKTINTLAAKIKLNLLIQSISTLEFLKKELRYPINGFIKIDMGYNRTGIQAEDFKTLDSLILGMKNSNNINFVGFLGHSGHSYNAKGIDEIKEVHHEALDKMNTVYNQYIKEYPNISISLGDTPTCSLMNSFGCATEIRPGNFVFYDLVQEQIGSCRTEQIAVALACPIVAIHSERNEVIIFGGGIHFSKDVYLNEQYGNCYGIVVNDKGNSWSEPIDNVYLSKISQEHGVIKGSDVFIKECKIGKILKILPVHSCMTADLMKCMVTTGAKRIEMMRYRN
ncbi:MAG: alanine racemase [Saprospiraceae bacterium]|nr:alanine racemase [Saprospiraceae bacterium]